MIVIYLNKNKNSDYHKYVLHNFTCSVMYFYCYIYAIVILSNDNNVEVMLEFKILLLILLKFHPRFFT